MQTKQQKRAEFALEKINNQTINDTYANFIVGMPTMILSNGLGQTMAFLAATMDKKAERRFVFYTIKEYLNINYPNFTNTDNKYSFLQEFTEIAQNEYIKIQDDILRMLEWLKRYARAFQVQPQPQQNANGEHN